MDKDKRYKWELMKRRGLDKTYLWLKSFQDLNIGEPSITLDGEDEKVVRIFPKTHTPYKHISWWSLYDPNRTTE